MSSARVVFDDREFKKFFATLQTKAPKELPQVVNRTTASTLREIKGVFLPKRTGNLRGSYQQRKIDDLSREIFSDSRYAPVIEFGGKARTVFAKPGKHSLTIPIKDSVLTNSKSQIKKSALDTLFRRLKQRRKGENSRDIMQNVGIILTKSAKLKAKPGQFNIKKKAVPFAEKRLFKEVKLVFTKLGFT